MASSSRIFLAISCAYCSRSAALMPPPLGTSMGSSDGSGVALGSAVGAGVGVAETSVTLNENVLSALKRMDTKKPEASSFTNMGWYWLSASVCFPVTKSVPTALPDAYE